MADKNFCPKCKRVVKIVIKNHSAMWGDGDVHCADCDTFIRIWDSG